MTTPTEDTWPGVSDLKDYKPTFPKWSDDMLEDSVKNLSSGGVDLMRVISNTLLNFLMQHFILNIYTYFCLLANVDL